MSRYTPPAGSIPDQVIKLFQEYMPGISFTTAEVLEKIGQPAGWCGLNASLKNAVLAGEIKCEKKPGSRFAYWSKGDGVPLPRPGDVEKDEPLHETPTAPRAMSSVFTMAQAGAAAPTKEVSQAKANLPKPATCTKSQTKGFACGLFSDGRLVLELADRTVVLPREHTELLVAFLDRLSPGVPA